MSSSSKNLSTIRITWYFNHYDISLTYSVSVSNFISSRTRLCKYSIDITDIKSPLFTSLSPAFHIRHLLHVRILITYSAPKFPIVIHYISLSEQKQLSIYTVYAIFMETPFILWYAIHKAITNVVNYNIVKVCCPRRINIEPKGDIKP